MGEVTDGSLGLSYADHTACCFAFFIEMSLVVLVTAVLKMLVAAEPRPPTLVKRRAAAAAAPQQIIIVCRTLSESTVAAPGAPRPAHSTATGHDESPSVADTCHSVR